MKLSLSSSLPSSSLPSLLCFLLLSSVLFLSLVSSSPCCGGHCCSGGSSPHVPACFCKSSASCCQYTLQGSSSWEELSSVWQSTLNNQSCCPSPSLSLPSCPSPCTSSCSNCHTRYVETSTGNGYQSAIEAPRSIEVGLASRDLTEGELQEYCLFKTRDTLLYQPANISTCVVRRASTSGAPSHSTVTQFCKAILATPTFSAPKPYGCPPAAASLAFAGLLASHGTVSRVAMGCSNAGVSMSASDVESRESFVGRTQEQVIDFVSSTRNSIGVVSLGALQEALTLGKDIEEVLIGGVSCSERGTWTEGPLFFLLNDARSCQAQNSVTTLKNILDERASSIVQLGLTAVNPLFPSSFVDLETLCS